MFRSVGHGIEPARTPGVTAYEALGCEPAACDGAVVFHSFKCISRTGGVIAAHLAVQRADREAICPQQPDEHPFKGVEPHRTPERDKAASRSLAREDADSCAARGSARITRRDPAGRSSRRSRIKWRRRRLTRLRTTAGPTALLTTNPTEIWAALPESPRTPGTTWATSVGLAERLPERIVCRKSSLFRMRFSRASKTQAESFARPFWRRDARIERPARVRMRRRKPCFLERRRLFGWKVRLDTRSSCSRKSEPFFRRPPLAHKTWPSLNGNCGHAAVVGEDYPTVRGSIPPVKLIHIRQPGMPSPRDTPKTHQKLWNTTCSWRLHPASVTAVTDFSTRSREKLPSDAQCVENHVDALEANDE